MKDKTEAAADTSNPDKEVEVSIGELREKLGGAPKPDGEIKLGAVVKSFNNEYWRTLRGGYGEYQTKVAIAGYSITIDVTSAQGENDEQGQLSIVKDMINKKYIRLLLSPTSDGNLTPGMEDAKKAGTPVINMNDGLIVNMDSFIGLRADQNGELAAGWTADKLDGKRKVAIVIGMPRAPVARQRMEGFENWVATNAKDIETAAKQSVGWGRQESKNLVGTWIKQYSDLNAIFCNNDTMALDVVGAVRSPGKDILVAGVDGIGEARGSIRRDGLGATTDSFSFYKAQIAGEVMLRSLGGQEIPRVLWAPQALTDSENMDKSAEEIIGRIDPVHARQTNGNKETIISQRIRPLTDTSKRGQDIAIMIHFSNITKQFPDNKTLDSVDFTVDKGEIHALPGENGAGKSTLLNIFHGIYPDYDGGVEIDRRKASFKNVNDTTEFDITKVHQEVNLMTELTVGQNIALSYEMTGGVLVDYDAVHRKTGTILKKLGCGFRSRDRVTLPSTGGIQMMLITKALFHNARIISSDEPTPALTDRETDRLLKTTMELRGQGITILYIVRRLDEVFSVADRASTLYDGKYIAALNMKEIFKEEPVRRMVGRDVSAYAVRNSPLYVAGEVVLEVRGLCENRVFEYISFELHGGEILPFAGLVGPKRTDMMRAIFGADSYTSGEVHTKGKKAEIKSPKNAPRYSLGLIPESRKTQDSVKNFINASSMALASVNRFRSKGFVNARRIYDNCMYCTGETNLHPAEPNYLAESLSGGNTQKITTAEWMTTDVDIIMPDEPAKGIDVGARTGIYRPTGDLVAGGKATIVVSSELSEVIGMSDRVVIMREGKIIGLLNHDELSEEVIIGFAMGG